MANLTASTELGVENHEKFIAQSGLFDAKIMIVVSTLFTEKSLLLLTNVERSDFSYFLNQ